MPRTNKPARVHPVHPMKKFLNFLAWLTGILVSLSVGFAMLGGNMLIPDWLGGAMASAVIGWVIVIATLIGVITAIFSK